MLEKPMKQGKVVSLEHGTAPRKRRDCSNPDGEASGASPRGVTWFCNKCRTHRAERCSCKVRGARAPPMRVPACMPEHLTRTHAREPSCEALDDRDGCIRIRQCFL